MKKIFPIILLVILGIAAWFFSTGKSPSTDTALKVDAAGGGTEKSIRDEMINDINAMDSAGGNTGGAADGDEADADGMFNSDGETKPAAQVYSNADDALKAVLAGAKDYDDLVLEQFTLPGEDCTWCPQFYKSVKDLLADQTITADQRSYYSEILAVSGSVDNLSTLVDGIKNAPSKEAADSFAEALELTIGKDDVVQFLSEHLSSTNETLREASVAAVTNQGSRLAAETLYKNTVERGDPDGYYSIGSGLGELVPDEETLPYLQELALKLLTTVVMKYEGVSIDPRKSLEKRSQIFIAHF